MDYLAQTKMKRRHCIWNLSGFCHWALALLLFAAGCATPIGVEYVDPHVGYQSLNANILSEDKPSSFSARELINLNLYQLYEDDPAKALAEMHAGLAPTDDEDRLFALAELSFAYADNGGGPSYYLAAAVYAYCFLLPEEHGTPPKFLDPRFRWAADIYNQALSRAAMIDAQPVPRGGTFKLPFGELRYPAGRVGHPRSRRWDGTGSIPGCMQVRPDVSHSGQDSSSDLGRKA